MKTIAVIPARGGSKRLPRKNIMSLGGLPLIAHSILYAKANPAIDAVFVSTDEDEIKRISIEFGAHVIDRPSELSGDFEPTVTSVQHVLSVLENSGRATETVILLQPTNPLRPPGLLQECVDAFLRNGTDSLFTVTRNYEKLGRIQNNKFEPFNYEPGQRSQDLEPLFSENGLLYISTANAIRKGEIISADAFPFVVDHVFSTVDIDDRADFEYAEYLYQKTKGK